MTIRELDTSSGVPLYRQIRDILRTEIVEGKVDGEVAMTEAQLLDRFGVSRAPIRQALSDLVNSGHIYRRQGKGTFPLVGARIERPADVRPGDLYRYLLEQGLEPTSRVETVERVVPPREVSRRLGIGVEETVLHFTRTISVKGEPLSHNTLYIRTPDGFDPSAADLDNGSSALDLLERQYGIRIERSEHEARATAATAEQAALLDVQPSSPLLVIDTTFFTTGGVGTAYRTALHRANEFSFRFHTTP
ncbi:GntR family transcriptional regulator [Agrococcus sp. DT81.2]|uniref:GntR family transcriptional regulator n=1 Tax=Agrococcus sp. DT81.2 TaxID=3393414 RepID=UPI003CE49BA9